MRRYLPRVVANERETISDFSNYTNSFRKSMNHVTHVESSTAHVQILDLICAYAGSGTKHRNHAVQRPINSRISSYFRDDKLELGRAGGLSSQRDGSPPLGMGLPGVRRVRVQPAAIFCFLFWNVVNRLLAVCTSAVSDHWC